MGLFEIFINMRAEKMHQYMIFGMKVERNLHNKKKGTFFSDLEALGFEGLFFLVHFS